VVPGDGDGFGGPDQAADVLVQRLLGLALDGDAPDAVALAAIRDAGTGPTGTGEMSGTADPCFGIPAFRRTLVCDARLA